MRVSLARHDEILRQTMLAHNGYVFKTVGDAFCVAFATANDAAAAAIAAQVNLHDEPWPRETPIRVRMAVHTGAVESRDDDYFGQPLNRVARLLSVAHGAQTVLSQTTYGLVRDALPGGSWLVDVGVHLLKDLARPEQIYQLAHPRLPHEFPPLRSLSNRPNNLPQQATNFIGRERELREVAELVRSHRLVTLTGSGGTGKTRLSLQVAADLLDDFPDGSWFVELAPLTEPAHVAKAVADIFGIKEDSESSLTDRLVRSLKDKKVLLILDNCEHLIEASARISQEIIRNCPSVNIFASSRELLGVSGEQRYRVPSLSLPDPSQIQTPDSLNQFESVRLFVDRALLARPDFTVSNDNAPSLASLCWRLDGIPLAIELAAARTRTLSVEEIEGRLDQRFRLLTGGSRTALPRQQTLRALVDWSYDLLNEQEKALLARASVFASQWSLTAAEHVCSGGILEDWEVLDVLTSLSDKSLVTVDHSHGDARFGFLKTVEHYAQDRLNESGSADEFRTKHLNYFTDWTQEIAKQFFIVETSLTYDRIELEFDNIRAALAWGTETKDPKIVDLIWAIWRYWWMRAQIKEGLDTAVRAEEALSAELTPYDQGRLEFVKGTMHSAFGRPQEHLDHLIRAEELLRDSDSLDILSMIHNGLGIACANLKNFDSSKAHYMKSIAIRIQIGDTAGIGTTYSNMAVTTEDQAEAMTYLQKAVEAMESIGDKIGMARVKGNMGVSMEGQKKFKEAFALHREALEIRFQFKERAGAAGSLEGLIRCCCAMNLESTYPVLATLYGQSARIREETGMVSGMEFQEDHSQISNLLGPEEFERQFELGYRGSLANVVRLADELSLWVDAFPENGQA